MTAADVVAGLVADLHAEAGSLATLLGGIAESSWQEDTPAVGWTVHDQIAHLAHFDYVTRLAISAPDEFVGLRDGLENLQTYVDSIGPANRARTGAEMLRWWSRESALLHAAALDADPDARIPWFGPSMSLASKVTARVMETWAHGQDVVDALGLVRAPTDRLRHVARIGVLAFGNSFRTNGLDIPEDPIRVELTPPGGGSPWTWGDPEAVNRVFGSAEDFCLVVTQRRNVADTGLRFDGDVATRWLDIAQAFAGPPGTGRPAGMFSRSAPTTGRLNR